MKLGVIEQDTECIKIDIFEPEMPENECIT